MKIGQRGARHHLREPLEIFLWSRAAIWLTAALVYLLIAAVSPAAGSGYGDPLLDDLGWALDLWARLDSVWFLRIAGEGYDDPSFTPAFAPLYPGVVGAVGRLLGGHYVLAGTLVSLIACAAAFVLLHRLARLRLDLEGATRSVLYLALFPTAVFLGAVYSESLYLALTIAAFLLAERGSFLGAGAVAGLAALTRVGGLALVPALAILAWRSRDRPRALASLAVAPAMWLLYPLVLWLDIGKPLAFVEAQRDGWQRELSPFGPLGGAWEGLVAGWNGLRQLRAAPGVDYFPDVTGASPLYAAGLSLQHLAFLVLFALLTVVAWRHFGAAYGAFAVLSLAIPLSSPADDYALLSLPRFGLAVFPFFLALAVLGARPRAHAAIVGSSAILLGFATVQWALWQWVA